MYTPTLGTYKLSDNGWVLLAVGTDIIRDETRERSDHSFIPFLFGWTRAESAACYHALFLQLLLCLAFFYNVPVDFLKSKVKFVVMDRSSSILAGAKPVFPLIEVLSCYAHFIRKVGDKNVLLQDTGSLSKLDYMKTQILPKLRIIATASGPDRVAFWALVNGFISWLEKEGHIEFCK